MDVLNLGAMLLFAWCLLANRARLEVPLAAPVLVIAVGSLLAVTNSESYSRSLATLAQDAYLYLWFIVMVNLMKDRGELRGFRVAWVWAACATAVLGIGLLVLQGRTSIQHFVGPKGIRAVALFDGPNSLADYLVMSLFVALSLAGQSSRWLVGGSMAVLAGGLVATKSNGATLALLLGLVTWAVVRAATRARSPLAVLGGVLLSLAVLTMGWWLAKEWDLGGPALRAFEERSFMARAERSADGRERIWHRLGERYARAPLGIGPGNSAMQRLSVGERERKSSFLSKEAHNDYIAYLVERGPLGLLGLLILMGQGFAFVAAGLARSGDRAWRAGAGGAIAAALAGGLVATAAHSFVMEKLHFRHFWMFLALAAAFALARPHAALARAIDRRPRRVGAPTRPGWAAPAGNGVPGEAR
jgi:O-antigen ligase